MNTKGIVVLMACFLLVSTVASGQGVATSAIAGVVRDASGGVLPGVTVEAASPALIEKVRTAVTDAQGLYQVVDLRTGEYTVTFSLPGFSKVTRTGIQLSVGFTATVNADLAVGNIEETVTVSGEAPLVDTRNVVAQTSLPDRTLNALPSTRSISSYATLVPGATSNKDVGGVQGERGATFGVHGGRANELNLSQDGLNVTMLNSAVYSFNPNAVEEVIVEVSGTSADTASGGVRVNIVPKDGGNRFSGGLNFSYTNPSLQSGNLSDELIARGLTQTPAVRKNYNIGGAFGGPIKRDKLWFYQSDRRWVASAYVAGLYFNALQDKPVGTDPYWNVLLYAPDKSRPAYTTDYFRDHSLRLTWQLSSKDKVSFSVSNQYNCNCPIESAASIAPEAAGYHKYQNPNIQGTLAWSRPVTTRLLFEAGSAVNNLTLTPFTPPGNHPRDLAAVDTTLGITYGSRAGAALSHTCCQGVGPGAIGKQYTQRFGISYITGSHAFKTGVNVGHYSYNHHYQQAVDGIHGARQYTFANGVPRSVTIFAIPGNRASNAVTIGAFAQDQWTIKKATVNLGLRYDAFNATAIAQHIAAGYFVPARDFPEVKNVPDWKNLDPRLGVAYDLFGTGRTAIKASWGRYVLGTSSVGNNGIALSQPIQNQTYSATRTWTDLNGNYVPDCVLGPEVPQANGNECGALSDLNFGKVLAQGTSHYSDDILHAGLNSGQEYIWRGSVSFEHELRPGLGVNVGYFRTWYGNALVTDNLAVAPADYDQYCLTQPTDSRLPGSGSRICGLNDIKPTSFGLVDNLITLAKNYGKQTDIFNGVDITAHARFGKGGQLQGGLSTGREVTDKCAIVAKVPESLLSGGAWSPAEFCRNSPPWSAATQVKFLVVYPLPWDLRASAVYQNLPGLGNTATYVATNAELLPSLQRNLGSCRGAATCNGTATINLVPSPATQLYEPRRQQIDLRFARTVRIAGVSIEGDLDLYNLFNANSVLTSQSRYGTAWLNAQEILTGRLVRFGGQINF